LLDKPSTEATAYEAAKADKSSTGLGSTTVALSPASFSQVDLLAGSGCITDKTVVVMGKTVVLPFSGLCPHLAAIGNINVAVSLLVAMMIVFRRGV
jgi:hypothetical protein